MSVSSDHVVALVKAWASGDAAQFRSVAIQVAAMMARADKGEPARQIRDIVDNAFQHKTYLPAFSGPDSTCAKCTATGVAVRYTREVDCSFDAMIGRGRPSAEFLELQCEQCGYTWYERCADARPVE